MCKKLVAVFLIAVALVAGCMKPTVKVFPIELAEEGRVYGDVPGYFDRQWEYARRVWSSEIDLVRQPTTKLYGFGTDPSTFQEFASFQTIREGERFGPNDVLVLLCRSATNPDTGEPVFGVSFMALKPMMALTVLNDAPPKVLAHELGHTFGLPHSWTSEKNCPYVGCEGSRQCQANVMNYCFNDATLNEPQWFVSPNQWQIVKKTLLLRSVHVAGYPISDTFGVSRLQPIGESQACWFGHEGLGWPEQR